MKRIFSKDILKSPIGRIVIAVLGIFFLWMGIPSLYEKIVSKADFDHNFKFAIAATFWGVFLLGYSFSMKKDNIKN